MLVLTRKIQESVIVGDDDGPNRVMKVTVLAIRGNRVRLGFEVDDDYEVHRWEVWKRIHDEKGPGIRSEEANGEEPVS